MTRPRRPNPAPLQTDDRMVAAVGAGAWTIALVVLLLIGLPQEDRWWLWVCVAGAAIGVFGYFYLPRLTRSRATDPEEPPQAAPPA
jgi:polyferredoxin